MRPLLIAAILAALSVAPALTAAPSGALATPVPAQARETAAGVVTIVARSPLTLRVAKRTPGARIPVLVSVQGRSFVRVLAVRADGVAVLRLAGVVLRRCQPVYVRLGGPRARLQILRLPSLDCPPTT